MIYKLFSIRDKYTGFMSPAPDVSEESAKRQFAFAVNNNPGVMNFSPRDYDLYEIGTYDNESGKIEALIPVKFIINGGELISEK